ncbi:hypothetical protein ABW20_dc0107548 [Dactylellina cionopaga]|nr:hypothetical protein ABW20_dc0107548 [Dactylellina cionopaga]
MQSTASTEARSAALSRLLKAAAGLATQFETSKQAAAKVIEWMNQDQMVKGLVGLLPTGGVSGLLEDPVVTILDVVTSIIPGSEEHVAKIVLEPTYNTTKCEWSTTQKPTHQTEPVDDIHEDRFQEAPRAAVKSTRWSDWDDDEEEEWVPEIPQAPTQSPTTSLGPTVKTVPEPTAGTAHKCFDIDESTVETTQEENTWRGSHHDENRDPSTPQLQTKSPAHSCFVPEVSEFLNEAAEDDFYAEYDNNVSNYSTSSCISLRSSEIQNPAFQGSWEDDYGRDFHYFGHGSGGNVWNKYKGEWEYKEGYYWDRHPFTPQMSAFERLTIGFDGVSVKAPVGLPGRRIFAVNRSTTAEIGERMRAKVAEWSAAGMPPTGTQETSRSHQIVDSRVDTAVPLIACSVTTTVTTATTITKAGKVDESEEQALSEVKLEHEAGEAGTEAALPDVSEPSHDQPLSKEVDSDKEAEEAGIMVALPNVSESPQIQRPAKEDDTKKQVVENDILALPNTNTCVSFSSKDDSAMDTSLPVPTDTSDTTTPPPSPPAPSKPAPMTSLELLISRGLYRDSNGVGPPSPPPPPLPLAKEPKKFRLRDLKPSWASKLESPVKSMLKACRKIGDRVKADGLGHTDGC